MLGVCRYPAQAGVVVRNPAVRACDVLVAESGRTIAHVSFPQSVAGEYVRRAPKTAISFTRRADSNPSATAATVEFSGMAALPAGALSVVSAVCVDRTGNPVADPQLSLE